MKRMTTFRPMVLLLVLLGSYMFAASVVGSEIAEAVVGALGILVIIPVFLMLLIDFYRTNDGSSRLSVTFNVLFLIPLALLGCASLAMGLGIIGWVLYNIFIEQMDEYSGPHWVLGFWSFGAGVPLTIYGWLILRSVSHRKDNAMIDRESREGGEADGDDKHAT